MKKVVPLNKLLGDIPYLYHRETIYEIGIRVNALIDRVNYLVEVVEKLEKRMDEANLNNTK